MKNIKEIKSILGSLREQIKKEYNAEILGIFGSYVRGEGKETSDMDILVRFDNGATLLDFGGLSVFLEEALGVKVDIAPIDVVRSEIKEEVLKEAVYL